MRLDRLLTLCLFRPIQPSDDYRLPILMYHSVSVERQEGVGSYYRTVTNPDVFARHMALLKSEGYLGVTLSTGLNVLNRGVYRGAKLIVITFDDGFRDFHTAAFPILQQHGFGATVFLPTAFIGDERQQFKSRECMTWSEVRELHRAGVEFGSHTVNHPRLVDLDWLDIERELCDSRREIEVRLETTTRTFAYPFAFPQGDKRFANRFRQLLCKTGYESCVTTEIGRTRPGDDRLRLCRLPANSDDDDRLLSAKLAGGYDWVAVPQAMSKAIRCRLRPYRRYSNSHEDTFAMRLQA